MRATSKPSTGIRVSQETRKILNALIEATESRWTHDDVLSAVVAYLSSVDPSVVDAFFRRKIDRKRFAAALHRLNPVVAGRRSSKSSGVPEAHRTGGRPPEEEGRSALRRSA